MLAARPWRLLATSQSGSLSVTRSYRPHTSIMSAPRKEKRPPLTHFLCLPLVNSVSLPQLESSIATFKAEIPSGSRLDQPLIPHGAIRPVGTLHLTLGVMSLPTQERLQEAIRFFQSLDLGSIMTEAENRAKKRRIGKGDYESTIGAQQPLIVSLESLHALPKARSATVLHAAPVDATSRLYPFCELLRDKFLEAGFLQGEIKNIKNNQTPDAGSGEGNTQALAEEPSLQEEMPDVAEETARASSAEITTKASISSMTTSKPKVRRLLLHATVVNTIYIKGRTQKRGNAKGNNRRNQYSFDARDILAHYRNYYVDHDRTTPRDPPIHHSTQAEGDSAGVDNSSDENDLIGEGSGQGNPDSSAPDQKGNHRPQNPFVWARDVPLKTVCICEMGAKKLDPDGDRDGMNARLGEKYMVVAERQLDFGEDPRATSRDGSMDGGVTV